MRILITSSEVHPYSKTGGLADMVGELGRSLARSSDHVFIVTPLYVGIQERFPGVQRLDFTVDVRLGQRLIKGDVWSLKPEKNLTVYFLDQPDFYHRQGVYQGDGVDYPDNAERFIFLSKGAVQIARRAEVQPTLVHAHDWQTGLVPLLIQHEQRTAGWPKPPKTCFTIHNMAYQGVFPEAAYESTNLPRDYFHMESLEFYGNMNCLKGGIAHADAITTVSPSYAREILTPEFGCGLDGLLCRRQNVTTGILNGVDYDEWNTTANPFLGDSYSADDLAGKERIKQKLQSEMELPEDETIPLFGSICRLVEQKGVDIQLGALEEMLRSNIQFVLLGTGARQFQEAFRELARRFPSKSAVRLGYESGLAHRIQAGCDFFLMPSRFEPCGLNQMYSLRYGTIPVVRVTGGLGDTVVDVTENYERPTGIKFFEYSARALAKAMRKACALYAEPELLHRYRRNGMDVDFSWEKAAREYRDLYRRAGADG